MLEADKLELPRKAPDGKAFADDAPAAKLSPDGKVDPGPLPQVRDHAAPVEIKPAAPSPEPEPPPDNDIWKMPLVASELLDALAEVAGDKGVGRLGIDPEEDDDLEVLLAWNRKDSGQFPVYTSGAWHGAVDLGLARLKPDAPSIADTIEVHAIARGTVVSRVSGNYVPPMHQEPCSDNHIVIRHPLGDAEVYALYLHLGAMSVEKGQEVSAHQVIGKIGQHGPFPHLHLAVISRTRLGGRELAPEGTFGQLGSYPEAQHFRRVKVPGLGRHWPLELRHRPGWYAYHPLFLVAWARGDQDLPPLPEIGSRQRLELKSRIGNVPILPGRKARIQVQEFLHSAHLKEITLLNQLSYNPDAQPVGEGAPKDAALAIARTLGQLGYDAGALDGDYGPKLKAAVQAFQEDARPLVSIRYPAFSGSIEAHGQVDWPTLIAMDTAYNLWGQGPVRPARPPSKAMPPGNAPKTGLEKWQALCTAVEDGEAVYGPGKGAFVPHLGWKLTDGGETWPVAEGRKRGLSVFPDSLANLFLAMYTNQNEKFDAELALEGPRAVLAAYEAAFELRFGGSLEPNEHPWRRYGDPATGQFTPVELWDMRAKLEGQHVLLYRFFDRRDAMLGLLSGASGGLETIMLFGMGPKSADGVYSAAPAKKVVLNEEELEPIEGEFLVEIFSLKPLRKGGLAPEGMGDAWSYPVQAKLPKAPESAKQGTKVKEDTPEELKKSPDATQPELDPGTTLEEAEDGTITAEVQTPDGPLKTTNLADGSRVQETVGPDGEEKISAKTDDGVEMKTVKLPDGTSQSEVVEPDGTRFVEEHNPDGSGRLIEKRPDGTVIIEEHGKDGIVKTTSQKPGEEAKQEVAPAPAPKGEGLLDKAAKLADKAAGQAPAGAGAAAAPAAGVAAAGTAAAGAAGAPAAGAAAAAGAPGAGAALAGAAAAGAAAAGGAPAADAAQAGIAKQAPKPDAAKKPDDDDDDDDPEMIPKGSKLNPPNKDSKERKWFKRLEKIEPDELESGDILIEKDYHGKHPIKLAQRAFKESRGSDCSVQAMLFVGDGRIITSDRDKDGIVESRVPDADLIVWRPKDPEEAASAVEVARWLAGEEVGYTSKRCLKSERDSNYGGKAKKRHAEIVARELPADAMMCSEMVTYCFQGREAAGIRLDARDTSPLELENYLNRHPNDFEFAGALAGSAEDDDGALGALGKAGSALKSGTKIAGGAQEKAAKKGGLALPGGVDLVSEGGKLVEKLPGNLGTVGKTIAGIAGDVVKKPEISADTITNVGKKGIDGLKKLL